MKAKKFLLLLALLGAGLAAQAQTYPTRSIKLMVGFSPGGGVDINARLLAVKLSEYLGQTVIVENKPGAGTNIANEFVAKAPPDGYTLLFNSPAVAINMSLYQHPPYDLLRDFAPVSIFSASTNILVVPASLPVKSVQELIKLAHDKPGTLNYSSAGSGSTQHLAGELFGLRTKSEIVHVPYKGSAPSISALLSGDVHMSFVNPLAIGGFVKSGRLRALAVAGPKRSALLPDVPTMKEAGAEGVEVPLWFGLLAPAATPKDVIATLAAAVAKAAKDPDTRKKLEAQGAEPEGNTPTEFAALLRSEVVKWAEVVKVSGAKAN